MQNPYEIKIVTGIEITRELKSKILNLSLNAGYSLCQLEKETGISRQNLHYYLINEGIHDQWKKLREIIALYKAKTREKKRREEDEIRTARSKLIEVLKRRVIDLSLDIGEDYANAASWYLEVEKYFKRKKKLEDIFNLINIYRQHKKNNSKRSLKKLGLESRLNIWEVQLILKKVGLKSMY